MSNQQEQQHATTTTAASRQEEYSRAQRVAHESVLIGRETVQAVAQQGEQLDHAERLADETQTKLHRANRVLKGMTWGGWVSNLVTPSEQRSSRPMTTTATSRTSQTAIDFTKYETLPDTLQPTAQAIRNYHANVGVLVECETDEQRVTCTQICNSMYAGCCRHLQQQASASTEATVQLKRDLDTIRKRQIAVQSPVVPTSTATTTTAANNTPSAAENDDNERKASLFGRPPASNTKSTDDDSIPAPKTTATATPLSTEQDQHLNVLAASLGEMGALAHTLNQGLYDQHDRLDRLETKSETVVEYAQQVGRRTDRMLQRKAWTKAKPILLCARTSLQHTATGRYLTILNDEAWLVQQRHPLHATFRVYKLHGTNLLGIQCEGTRKWLGQGFLLGSLTCTAKTLGRREEWQMDSVGSSGSTAQDDTSFTSITTRLLCASAGWGQGGYLEVSDKLAVQIGGIALTESRNAARWTLGNLDASGED